MTTTPDASVSRRITGRLALAALGPPLAWLVQLGIGWGAEEWICRTGLGGKTEFTVLALVLSAVALTVAVTAGLAGRRQRRASRDENPTVSEGRDYFFGIVGIASAVLFGSLIVLTALPLAFLEPCTS